MCSERRTTKAEGGESLKCLLKTVHYVLFKGVQKIKICGPRKCENGIEEKNMAHVHRSTRGHVQENNIGHLQRSTRRDTGLSAE
jgi:hypothetical protein